MIYFGIFIFGFSLLQLLVAFVNLVFGQSFSKTKDKPSDLVSILIPARNEEKNIGNLLNDVQNQEYHNIEILVFNDQSTDKTSEIVLEHSKSDNRIKLINSDDLPEGWLGKNFACHSLAKNAKGHYYLFLDADVRISKDIIINTVNQLKKYKLGLLTIFPKQIMKTWGEWITVPNMNFILLSLLPLILVRKLKFSSLAAANGQFMLFDAQIYQKYKPHELMKDNKVEDIEIARFYKSEKITIACLAGNENISCRMYQSFKEAVNGFSKNVVNFFGNSYLLTLMFWLITSFGFIVILFSMDYKFLMFYLIIILFTRIMISLTSRQSVLYNILLIIPQQLALGMFIYKSVMNKFKKQHQWKGRNIS
ncbi:MAG: glycosyltransferase family 2 protein [Bacteroidales bacterium]